MRFPSRRVADPLCQRNWEASQKYLDHLTPTYVTSLPPHPYDGQQVIYGGASDANGTMLWNFRYRSASPGAYKWEFVGGSPLLTNVDTQFSTTSASMVEHTSRLTMPLSGVYECSFGARPFHVNGAGVAVSVGLLRTGVFTGVKLDSFQGSAGSVTTLFGAHQQYTFRVTEAAGAKFSLGFATSSGTAFVQNSWLRIQPVAVG